jgi:hypothetical protein
VRRLEHDALTNRGDDVASEIVLRALSEGYVRPDRSGIIFFGDLLDPLDCMFLDGIAGFDLMVSDMDIHLSRLLSWAWRAA